MSKKKKIILITAVVALLSAVALGIVGSSLEVKDSLFNTNTPIAIPLNYTAIGTLSSADDYESFLFEIPEDGILTARIEHDDLLDAIKCGYEVTIYKITDQREYREVNIFRSFWSDTTANSGEIGVSAGTYCAIVVPGNDIIYGDFDFVTTFTPTKTYEKELNDTKDEANPIDLGIAFYGTSCERQEGGDIDWFSFELTEEKTVSIQFSHEDLKLPATGWNITLSDEEGKIITSFNSQLKDVLKDSGNIGLRAGKYFLKVEGQGARADVYKVQVTANSLVNREIEFNDTPETATQLPEGYAINGSLSDRVLSLDRDYYKFGFEGEGYIDVEFKHSALEGDNNGWNIRVFKAKSDGTYEEIIRKISKWNQSSANIMNLGLPAGEYLLLIDGDEVSYNSADYTLSWEFTEHENFETELNNTTETSEKIGFDIKYYGAVISSDSYSDYDADYYEFTLAEQTNISMFFGHDRIAESLTAWDITIVKVDEYGEETVVARADSAMNEALITTGAVTLDKGTYYVRVEGFYTSEIPYNFWLVR